jgi:polyhydroxyalkanoate synthesis regulator phasin
VHFFLAEIWYSIGHQTKPEHERQVRPLVGLTAEQAQKAWDRAIEKAGGRKITARLVKAAVQKLQPPRGAKPVKRETGQTKAQQRKLIDGAIGELLVLLSQKASHEVLTQKVEALHGQIRSLFPKPSSKASQPGPA